MRMSGVSGELKRSYLTVARLGSWTMDGGGRVEAAASDVNEYHLEHGALTLLLPMGRRTWVWSDVEVAECANGRLVLLAKGSPTVQDAG
jgi:hypothetical protein